MMLLRSLRISTLRGVPFALMAVGVSTLAVLSMFAVNIINRDAEAASLPSDAHIGMWLDTVAAPGGSAGVAYYVRVEGFEQGPEFRWTHPKVTGRDILAQYGYGPLPPDDSRHDLVTTEHIEGHGYALLLINGKPLGRTGKITSPLFSLNGLPPGTAIEVHLMRNDGLPYLGAGGRPVVATEVVE
jgi:hypothetical protein